MMTDQTFILKTKVNLIDFELTKGEKIVDDRQKAGDVVLYLQNGSGQRD